MRGERGPKGDHGQTGDKGEQGEGAPRYALVGYLIMAAAMAIALFGVYKNTQSIRVEREARSASVNTYLVNRCKRARAKDAIFIGILTDSQTSLQSKKSDLDEALRHRFATRLAAAIAGIKRLDRTCVDAIPPVTPSH